MIRRVALYCAAVVVLLTARVLIRDSQWASDARFHTLQEMGSTLLAAFAGSLALLRYYGKKTDVFLLIGTGLLVTAFLDGYHMLVSSAALEGRLPSDLSSLAPWSWLAPRTFLSLLLLLSGFAIWREGVDGRTQRFGERGIIWGGVAMTLACFVFFTFVPLPRAHYPEFTLHRPQELFPAAIFLLALVGHLRHGDWRIDPLAHWLVVSLIFAITSHVVFMAYSEVLFDAMFDFAHLLKSISYLCVVIGLSIHTSEVFRSEAAAVEATQANARRLARTNLELRHASATLKDQNQALEQFAYVVSHDLQEPMRTVASFSELLRERYQGRLDEEADTYIGFTVDGIGRMQRLLDDLRAMTRVRSHQQILAEIDSGAALDDALANLATALSESGGEITRSSLPYVIADRGQLTQVFQNLVGNAIKFRRGSNPPTVHIGADRRDDDWVFSVRDDGIGIEPGHAERIFRVFQRLHLPDEYDGTGVGLAITKGIVERHGGRLWVESKLGVGSTFYFNLPRARGGGDGFLD